MSGNSNTICTKCRKDLKIFKSGMGKFYLQCGCGIADKGFSAIEVAKLSGLDEDIIKKIAINLMISDVCV